MCWTNVYQEQCAGVADSAADLRQDPLNAVLSLHTLITCTSYQCCSRILIGIQTQPINY